MMAHHRAAPVPALGAGAIDGRYQPCIVCHGLGFVSWHDTTLAPANNVAGLTRCVHQLGNGLVAVTWEGDCPACNGSGRARA